MADLAKAVSSSGEVVFITSAARAASAKVLQPELAPLILASPALADDRLVALDPAALLHVAGAVVDYVDDALSSRFVFDNPNARGACGCGGPPA